MASSGPLYASSCVNDSSIGTTAWTNPGNATTDNSSVATANASFFGTTLTQYLKATGFGFSIPTGSTINGIVVEWKKQKTGGTGECTDTQARIVKGGTIGSTNKASASDWSTSSTYQSYGGASDLWGTTWSPSDINASTFGATLAASVHAVGIPSVTANVDACRITVYYTLPSIALAADLASASGVTAALTTDINLEADIASASTASASITTGIKLASDLSSVSSATASLSTEITVSADLSSASTSSADLTTAVKLAADLSSIAVCSAALATEIQLSAGLSSSSSLTAETRTVLESDLASESAITADLSTAIKLASNLSSASDVTADLLLVPKLSCLMASESECSGLLKTAIKLNSGFESAAEVTVDISTAIKLSSSLSSGSAVTAGMTTAISMASSGSSTSTLAGSLSTDIKLASGLESASSVSGLMTTEITLTAVLASASTVGADFVVRFPRYLAQTETIFLAEIEAYDPDTSSVVMYRYSSGRGFDNGGIFYEPRIENPASFNREVSIDGSRGVGSYGELTLVNVDGGCNALASDYCDGRRLTLKVGPQTGSYGAFQTVLIATINDVTVEHQRVSIRLKDAGAAFDKPFSTAQYAGTNALPLGIEGTEDDIKGQYKPRIFGRVALMQPVLVNTSKLIYQVSNSAIDAIANVFDAGAYLTRGSDYSSQSDMETNAPSPGYYRVWLAGGCFRVGSAAFGTISCSVAEKWNYSQISAGGIIQRIFSEIGFTDYVSGDFTALNAKTSAPLGILVENGETIADLIDRICGTIGAYWGFDALNRFRIGRLDAPSSPVAVITDDHLIEIERQPRDALPAWKVSIDADANYAKQDKKSLAGIVTTAREAWLSAEYRTRKSENATVKTAHLLADEQKSESLFCSVSQSQAEATRRLNLHSSRRDNVSFSVPIQCPIFSSLEIGATVTLQTDMLGYSAGRNMIITMMAPDYRAGICQLTAWG